MTLTRSPVPVKNIEKPKTICALNDKMEEMFNNFKEHFTTELEKQLSFQRDQLIDEFDKKMKKLVTEEVNNMIKPINEKLDSAVKKIAELEKKLKTAETTNENQMRANNVTISGIPLTQDENLRETIKLVSAKLGFQQPISNSARRFPSASPSKSIISLRFNTPTDKVSFLNAYFKIQPKLILKDVTGKNGDNSRIFINHDLSKEQYEIHKKALSLKKEGKIMTVKVINNQIAIIKNNHSKQVFISSIQHLSNELE